MIQRGSYMTCPDCGMGVLYCLLESHKCNPERVYKHFIKQYGHEVKRLERDIVGFFLTSKGEFEIFYAERQRSRAAKSPGSQTKKGLTHARAKR